MLSLCLPIMMMAAAAANATYSIGLSMKNITIATTGAATMEPRDTMCYHLKMASHTRKATSTAGAQI